jgi:hypothetical protein
MNQKKYKSILILAILTFVLLIASGKSIAIENSQYNISNFRKVVSIEDIPSIKFPQVVEIESRLGTYSEIFPETLLLSNDTDRLSVPVYKSVKDIKTLGYDVFLYPRNESTFTNLSDGKADTYEDLQPNGTDNPHRFIISFIDLPKVIGLDIKYAPQSEKPNVYSVSVEQSQAGMVGYYIINKSGYASDSIRFSKVENEYVFILELYSKKPMRITDIVPVFETPYEGGIVQRNTLRFLAQPDKKYSLYYDVDANSWALNQSLESIEILQNPVGNSVIPVVVDFFKAIDNPSFTPSDKDYDGILDTLDNCPKVSNPDQIDTDKNGVGDYCDDFDKDGVFNPEDNCAQVSNRYQEDTDGDKIGDACDNEEIRVIEKYPWLPWIGIIVGLAVMGGVLVISFKQDKKTSAEIKIEEDVKS